MKLWRHALYPACGLLVCFCCRASDSINCPDTVHVRQQLSDQVEGWTAVVDDTPHRLATITFYDGRPEEKASLINDQSTRSGKKETAIWHFIGRADRRIWIACSYSGTVVTLAKELPAKTAECAVTYNSQQRVDGQPVIETVSCR